LTQLTGVTDGRTDNITETDSIDDAILLLRICTVISQDSSIQIIDSYQQCWTPNGSDSSRIVGSNYRQPTKLHWPQTDDISLPN